MLPTQVNSAVQTDILPTQNIGLLDQSQPQIYSLLANSNSPTPAKQSRRKRTAKLDETKPVMVNPQITRTPTGVTFAARPYRSTILPESIPSFVSTRLVNGHTTPFSLYLEHNLYDANNNINNNQIPTLSMSLNPSLPTQAQQKPTWSNDSLPVINTNSIPQLVTKPPLFGLNRSLNNNINERTGLVPSPQQNEYTHPNSSFTFTDQGSLPSHSPSLPLPLSSIVASNVPSVKPKRKYTKRLHPSAPIEQQQQPAQQTSSCPPTITQPTVSNGLPSIIPTSVTPMPLKSEEHPLLTDMPTASNFAPLTPPGSINSVKSPPTNIINEPSVVPVQQHFLPYTNSRNNIAEISSISKQYFPDQGFSYAQKTINDLSTSNLSYNLHRLLANAHGQYCMVPSNLMPTNILPMTCSSIVPRTVTSTSPVPIPAGMKKEREKREKGTRKSKVIQKSTVERLRNEQSLTSKSQITDISTTKKRKHKNSNMKDIRTTKQLRRIKRRNRLAILKFMIRKRKQQKQQLISIPKLSEVKVEQLVPELVSTHIATPDKMETNLPDIIVPSLKISLDTNQKIESISLYYYRRHKPDITNANSPKTSTIADNRLGLLIEAVDFIETLQSNLKLAPPSNQ